MKNFNDTIRNRTRDQPVFSAVPQPSTPPRAPLSKVTGSISPETYQPEGEADYSLLSLPEVKHGLYHIALHSLCNLMALISNNLHSRIYVLSVMHCIYHITFCEALPF